jgi:XTP/dITP diphosphohydrolase
LTPVSAASIILLASHNTGKVAEVRRILEPMGIRVQSAGDAGLPEPAETAPDFAGNARLKALSAMQATGLSALADDSGLVVDALDGRPGVATAELLMTDRGRNAAVGMRRVAEALWEAGASFPSPARFVSVLVLVRPLRDEVLAAGEVRGYLVWPPRGAGGHGLDAMFLPQGCEQTFGEMANDEKDNISHRGRALRALLDHCFT